ncbi:MAG: hypothetical protein QW184_00855 [Nanopusillaceae archaeon]
MRKAVSTDVIIFIIIALFLLIIGIFIVSKMYDFSVVNIRRLNETYNKTLGPINK